MNLDVEPAQRYDLERRALEVAQLHYAVFVTNPSGAALLKQWKQSYVTRRVPVNASINEYVAAETRRGLVVQIEEQIEIAKRGSIG